MASQLQVNLENILNEKTTKILPENIKKDVQIFDVVGTLESGGSGEVPIKLFTSVDEMNADTTAKEGEIAEVYVDEKLGIIDENYGRNVTHLFIPDVVVMPEAVPYSDLTSFQSITINPSDGGGSLEIFASSTQIKYHLSMYSYSGSWSANKTCIGTSTDGITYTFDAENTEIKQALTDTIKSKSNSWDGRFNSTYNKYINAMLKYRTLKFGIYTYKNGSWVNRDIGTTTITSDKIFKDYKVFSNNEFVSGSYVAPTKASAMCTIYGMPTNYSSKFNIIMGNNNPNGFSLPGFSNGDLLYVERNSKEPMTIGCCDISKTKTLDTDISPSDMHTEHTIDISTNKLYICTSIRDKNNSNNARLWIYDMNSDNLICDVNTNISSHAYFTHVCGDNVYFTQDYNIYKLNISSKEIELIKSRNNNNICRICTIKDNLLYYVDNDVLYSLNLETMDTVEISSLYSSDIWFTNTLAGIIIRYDANTYKFVKYGENSATDITGNISSDKLVNLYDTHVQKIKGDILYLPKGYINLTNMEYTEYNLPTSSGSIYHISANVNDDFDFLCTISDGSDNYIYTITDGIFTQLFNGLSLKSNYDNLVGEYCMYDKQKDIYLCRRLSYSYVTGSTSELYMVEYIYDIAGYKYYKVTDYDINKISNTPNIQLCQYVSYTMSMEMGMSEDVNYVISFGELVGSYNDMFYKKTNYTGTISPTEYDTALATSEDILGTTTDNNSGVINGAEEGT